MHVNIQLVEHVLLKDREELDEYESAQVALGYEGVMLADPLARYKFGRATTKGGELLKVKRFVDSEAIILDVVEEMFNGNEAETNELGRTKRSSHQAGKSGKGTMGALVVRDVLDTIAAPAEVAERVLEEVSDRARRPEAPR
jgi:DNA ligase-1